MSKWINLNGELYGCLADGCQETRETYPEIDKHMTDAHGIEGCGHAECGGA